MKYRWVNENGAITDWYDVSDLRDPMHYEKLGYSKENPMSQVYDDTQIELLISQLTEAQKALGKAKDEVEENIRLSRELRADYDRINQIAVDQAREITELRSQIKEFKRS